MPLLNTVLISCIILLIKVIVLANCLCWAPDFQFFRELVGVVGGNRETFPVRLTVKTHHSEPQPPFGSAPGWQTFPKNLPDGRCPPRIAGHKDET